MMMIVTYKLSIRSVVTEHAMLAKMQLHVLLIADVVMVNVKLIILVNLMPVKHVLLVLLIVALKRIII